MEDGCSCWFKDSHPVVSLTCSLPAKASVGLPAVPARSHLCSLEIAPWSRTEVCTRALQDYVHSRIIKFAGEQGFARRLYASPAVVKAAAEDALSELQQPSNAAAAGQRQLKLVFRHTCL